MLKIFFGISGTEDMSPDDTFDFSYSSEWWEDPLVLEMIKDVDKTEIVSDRLAQSEALGAMRPLDISGGVKTLIMMLKDPEYIADGCSLGRNCFPWVVKLSHISDCFITISIGVRMGETIDDPTPLDAYVVNYDLRISTVAEFYEQYFRWLVDTMPHPEEDEEDEDNQDDGFL
jgi:hypothetical protein